MQIRVHGRGQRAADGGRILGNGRCGGRHGGRIVGAVDGYSQSIAARAAVIVGHREGEGLGQTLPYAQALHCGQAVVQGIDIIARGIQCECAVETGGIGLRGEGHSIMNIRIHGRGQRAADAGRILGNGGRGSGHGGRVVTAVDAHGHNSGRRAAVVVRDCDNECVGQAFARAQPLYRGQ